MSAPHIFWLVAFVGFLIEKYGLAMFRALCETGSYEKVYAKSMPALEEEWRLKFRSKRKR